MSVPTDTFEKKRPSPTEEAYAARLWLVLLEHGPHPGCLDLVAETADEAGDPLDVRAETFAFALRTAAVKWLLADGHPDGYWNPNDTVSASTLRDGQYDLARGQHAYLDGQLNKTAEGIYNVPLSMIENPAWQEYVDRFGKAIDLLEYVAGL